MATTLQEAKQRRGRVSTCDEVIPVDDERALLDAMDAEDVAGVLRCLDQRLSIDWRNAEGCGALFLAAYRRQWSIIDALLARGADIDLPDRKGWTPLFWAAFNGHADIVASLVARGADPNRRTLDDEWPLFWAAYKGYEEVVRVLIAGGARLDEIDSDGHDAGWVARAKGHTAIVELLETCSSSGGLASGLH